MLMISLEINQPGSKILNILTAFSAKSKTLSKMGAMIMSQKYFRL